MWQLHCSGILRQSHFVSKTYGCIWFEGGKEYIKLTCYMTWSRIIRDNIVVYRKHGHSTAQVHSSVYTIWYIISTKQSTVFRHWTPRLSNMHKVVNIHSQSSYRHDLTYNGEHRHCVTCTSSIFNFLTCAMNLMHFHQKRVRFQLQ
jgi:hypothetical protein